MLHDLRKLTTEKQRHAIYGDIQAYLMLFAEC